jgi:hypothetical protein
MARDLLFCLNIGYTEKEFWRMTPRKIYGLYRAVNTAGPDQYKRQSIRDIMPI